MLQDGLFFCRTHLQPPGISKKPNPLRIPRYLLIPLFIIGGGLYAIPYQTSLSSMNLMSAVCGVFLFAMVFSLPGAWIQRGHFVPGRKSIAGIVSVALFLSLIHI